MGMGGVILAAGESTRMGQDKALLPWPPASPHSSTSPPGRPPGTLLSAAIGALAAHSDLVIVVAGKNAAALRPVVDACGAQLVRNPHPELGQFSSLKAGLGQVLGRGRDSAMITLVDRPPPMASTLTDLAGAFRDRGHRTWAVIPQYQGRHGHPILVGRELIEEFLKAPMSASARDVEHANGQRILYLAVDDPLVIANADTPEDYASLKSPKS